METKVTIGKFKELLPLICDKETSRDPHNWTPDNPLFDHCLVISRVAKTLFGGDIMYASLRDMPEFARMRPHYWNRFPDGTEHDFTALQFGDNYPNNLVGKPYTRQVLYNPKTGKPRKIMNRYKLLFFRLAKLLNNNNPLFEDVIYKKCFYAAVESRCQKMKFGCVITHNNKIVYEGCNKTIEPLKSLCEPKCIRLSITSRTESMLGACGHAEEGLWDVIHKGIPIHECEFYIAGLYATSLPWIKEQAVHTCLRCAVQMYNAKVQCIYVPVIDQWAGISAKQAVETARAYATSEKKV